MGVLEKPHLVHGLQLRVFDMGMLGGSFYRRTLLQRVVIELCTVLLRLHLVELMTLDMCPSAIEARLHPLVRRLGTGTSPRFSRGLLIRLSLIHISEPRDVEESRMPSSA